MTIRQLRVLECWNDYAAKVLPPDAPEVQRTECRRAFFAGAAGMFAIVMGASNESNREAEAILRGVELELLDVVPRLRAGGM